MNDLEQAVARARAAMAMTLQHARTRLLAGADVRQVQSTLDMAARYLEDAETYALLAAEGEVDARDAITERIAQLEALRDSIAGYEGG